MKNLNQIIQGTKNTLKKGKEKIQRGITLGSYLGLGAASIGIGGCTIPPQSEPQNNCEIFTYTSWVDKNGDNFVDPKTELNLKTSFKRGELAHFLVAWMGCTDCVNRIEIRYNNTNETVCTFPEQRIIKLNQVNSGSVLFEKTDSPGEYTFIVYVNGIPKASKVVTVY